MSDFEVRSQDGSFIAKVKADSATSAINLLLSSAGCAESQDEGIVIYADRSKVKSYLTDAGLDAAELRKCLTAIESAKPIVETFAGKLCAYCGINPSTNKDGDHVIARGFFADTNRSNTNVPILVPACTTCNGQKSSEEEYAIPRIAGNFNANHPDARALYAVGGPIQRSIERGRGPALSMAKDAKPFMLFFSELQQLALTGVIGVDWSRFDVLYNFIVRGLYYFHENQKFPDTHETYAFQVSESSWLNLRDQVLATQYSGPYNIGEGVFEYVYALDADNNGSRLWLTSFYDGSFPVVVIAVPERRKGDLLSLDRDYANVTAGYYALSEKTPSHVDLKKVAFSAPGEVSTTGEVFTCPRFDLAAFKPVSQLTRLQ